MNERIRGRAYVVGDNVDTDQIIPAQHLSLVPTIEAEYRRLGRYAMSGLPRDRNPVRLFEGDEPRCRFAIVIAGRNFGCGSSREHAPIALGAAGIRAVVAESYARIFFRNCLATGELYPLESADRLCDTIRTGDPVELDLDSATVRVNETVSVALRPPGEGRRIVSAGGLFAYARETGLVESESVRP